MHRRKPQSCHHYHRHCHKYKCNYVFKYNYENVLIQNYTNTDWTVANHNLATTIIVISTNTNTITNENSITNTNKACTVSNYNITTHHHCQSNSHHYNLQCLVSGETKGWSGLPKPPQEGGPTLPYLESIQRNLTSPKADLSRSETNKQTEANGRYSILEL